MNLEKIEEVIQHHIASFAWPDKTNDVEEALGLLSRDLCEAMTCKFSEIEQLKLNNISLERRLKWAQTSSEKHHEGNRAACEREEVLADKLAITQAKNKELRYTLDQVGFMLAGTQFDGVSKTIMRVLNGENLDDIRRGILRK